MKTNKVKILTFSIIFLSMAFLVTANTPLGAQDIVENRSETVNISNYDPESIEAIAGNLTQIHITGITQTKSWQGFFGNVTGTITLEDAAGNRFYDWSAVNPQGQVYASINETISWSTVECAPMHTDNTFLGRWHTVYGMNNSDYDSINNTFNLTSHPEIYVGYETINGCPTTNPFVNSASQQDDFFNLLLTSDSQSTLVFTTILETRETGVRGSKEGFDGGMYDFQLLVAEDGSQGNSDTTTYYFWVEIS